MMAIEIKDWTKQIEDLQIMGVDQLHETYSEMLATAHDIRFEVPDELLVETEDDVVLRDVISKLHPMIVQFASENSRESADSQEPEREPARGKKTAAARKSQKKDKESVDSSQSENSDESTNPTNRARPASKKGQSTKSEKESTKMSAAKKTAKKAPAKKAASKKTAKGSAKKASANARTPVASAKFRGDAVITVKLKENPARAGTGRHERVANLMKHNGKTVDQFLKSGGKRGTLNFSAAEGWITIK